MATVRYRLDSAFDAVGNLTNRLLTGLQGMSGTLTTRYRYDVMNRLTNVVQLTNGAHAATASYAYDAVGQLAQPASLLCGRLAAPMIVAESEKQTGCGKNRSWRKSRPRNGGSGERRKRRAGETGGGLPTRRYGCGGRPRSGTTTVGRDDDSAFGVPRSALGPDVCRLQFSSKERDPATGWRDYGFRYYAPQWQRWLNWDPMGSSEGPNLYGFCDNEPIANLDVDGRSIVGTIFIAGLLKEGSCFAAAAAIGMNYSFPRDSHEHKRHCLVGCLTTRMWGAGSTIDGAAQVIKEILFGIKDYGWPWNWDWKESWKDTVGWVKGHGRGMIPGPACGCFKACNTSDLDS